MRKLIQFTLLLLLINNYCYSQSENWKTLSTRRCLTYINFFSNTKALIFGEEIIYNYSSNGDYWNLPFTGTLNIEGYGPRFETLNFVDSLYGWVYNRSTNRFFKTTNSGVFWNQLTIPSSFNSVTGIDFVNRSKGFICGPKIGVGSQIAQTTNGGLNWLIIATNLNFIPGQICMLTEMKGLIIPSYDSYAGDSVGLTTNGGYNWNYQRVANSDQRIVKVFFIDTLRGWALGSPGYVSRTTNGGINWIVSVNSVGSASNMFFLDASTGWITTYSYRIWKSTNSGVNWFQQVSNPGSCWGDECAFLDVYFKDGNTGWALQRSGTVFKSTNGGINWFTEINPPLGDIESINFINSETGWLTSK